MVAKKNEVTFATKQTNRLLTRATKKRELAQPILIMCEGEKTEIHYFKGLCQRLGIGRPQIMIKQASSGNDPLHIVNDALELHKTDAYSKIYCVFDKDMHTRYDRAIEKIKTKGKSIPIVAIHSVPCFEYWLLLHFEYTSQQHTQKGDDKVKKQLERKIKKYVPNYEQSDENMFRFMAPHLETAVLNAKRLDECQKKSGTDNPSTKVYVLVEDLQSLSKKTGVIS